MGDTTTYQQTLDYLYEKLPMFSRIGAAALKPDLTNTIRLCIGLGDPQQKFKSIHIAGTNGKGSTSHMLAAACRQQGYKTGLYTSPHLVDFRERIRIDGAPVSKEWVVAFVREHKALIEKIKPSFFEITVVMAFKAFAEAGVDIAIIETGLGGRLDSTNVITPLLSIITNISYDHQDLLGHTLGEIASEKAGIIKPNVPVVIGEQHDETERIFFEHSVHKRSTVYYAQTLWGMVRTGEDGHYQYYKAVHNAHREMYTVKTDLLGNYQQHNIKTVLTAAEVLTRIGFKLTMENTVASLAHVKSATGLRGRWDIVQQQPTIICDVAHNPAGLKEVLKQLESKVESIKSKDASGNSGNTIVNTHIVIGFVKDKDVAEALALFPKDATFYFCNADNPRALPATDLKAMAAQAGLQGNDYPTIAAAVNSAKDAMNNDDVLLITGSFFIVGDALAMLQAEVVNV